MRYGGNDVGDREEEIQGWEQLCGTSQEDRDDAAENRSSNDLH